MRLRFMSIMLIGLILLTAVAGCARGPADTEPDDAAPSSGGDAAPAPAPPQERTIRITGDITNLDPAYFSLLQDFEVASNIYSALVRYDPRQWRSSPTWRRIGRSPRTA